MCFIKNRLNVGGMLAQNRPGYGTDAHLRGTSVGASLDNFGSFSIFCAKMLTPYMTPCYNSHEGMCFFESVADAVRVYLEGAEPNG